MTTLNSEKIVYLAEHISQNLAFRHSSDDLFNYINNLEDSNIIIDFSEIKFMSSSFAHQYLINKKATKKNITESNKTSDVIQMFELVERRRSKLKETSNEPIEVLKLVQVEKNERFHIPFAKDTKTVNEGEIIVYRKN